MLGPKLWYPRIFFGSPSSGEVVYSIASSVRGSVMPKKTGFWHFGILCDVGWPAAVRCLEV